MFLTFLKPAKMKRAVNVIRFIRVAFARVDTYVCESASRTCTSLITNILLSRTLASFLHLPRPLAA